MCICSISVYKCRFESHLSICFLFSLEKEIFRFVVLHCFDVYRPKSFHVRVQVGMYGVSFIAGN